MDMISQVDEFEEFVNNFSSQMEDILKKDTSPSPKTNKPCDVVKKAEAERLKGNGAFKVGDYSKAIGFYNSAINMFSKDSISIDPVLYTNRALAFLKTNEYKKALDDCNAAHKLDPNSIKAIWRRISAYRGLKEFRLALEDVVKLKDFGIIYALILVLDNSGISVDDVNKMRRLVESEQTQYSHEQDLKSEMDKDGSKLFMEQVFISLEKGLDEYKGGAASSELNMTCTVLMKLLDSHESASGIVNLDNLKDAFRVFGGFERLVKRTTLDTVPIIMPILMCLLHNNQLNKRHISKHISQILSCVFSTLPQLVDGSKITTAAMVVDLLGNCAREEACLQALCSQKFHSWTENVGATTMAILAMKRNSVRGSVHIYYALTFVHALLSCSKGIDAFFRIYKFNLSQILASISLHFSDESIEGEKKTMLSLSVECIQSILKSEIPIKSLAVNHSMHSLVTAACANFNSSSVSFEDIVTLLYNLLIYLDHPISDTVTQTNLPLVLLNRYRSDQLPICLHTVAKLVKFHSKQVATYLGQVWSDAEMKKIIKSSDAKNVKAGLQLLASWLHSSDSHVSHWMKQGGFDMLIHLLIRENAKLEMDGYILGNAALCLGECALKADHARYLVKMNAIDPLVNILQKNSEPGVQRNIAIVCARLCQVSEGLERIRALKGIELMYGLGNKIMNASR